MIDITLQNLETDLIGASMQQPVLLDIWAPWCAPCKALGPMLEKLEVAYAGRFKLAKLNSDEQPDIAGQLSQAFGVRSIPFCVLFDQGQPVDGFVGALPEDKIREFLDKHLPSLDALEAQEQADEAHALADEGNPDAALAKLLDALATDPNNDAARADCIKLLLESGAHDPAALAQARELFTPVAGKTLLDARLNALGVWLATCERVNSLRSEATLTQAIHANKRDFEARFDVAQHHLAKGRFTDAMDALLEIVMRDKAWNDQAARKTYVAILELMTKPAPKAPAAVGAAASKTPTLEVTGKAAVAAADPVVDGYRRKLSMALF
jgi:putative thioredoxin